MELHDRRDGIAHAHLVNDSGPALAQLDRPVAVNARTDRHTQRAADEIRISELFSGSCIAIIEEHIQSAV